MDKKGKDENINLAYSSERMRGAPRGDDDEPSIKKGIKRGIRLVLGLCALVVGFILILGTFSEEIARYTDKKETERLTKETEQVTEDIKNAYRNDFDGGKTPEETFDLFLTALRGSDIRQASLYYELSVQPEALSGLENEMREQGNLTRALRYFTDVREKGVKQCNQFGDGCVFEYKYITEKDETTKFGELGDSIFIPKGSERRKLISISLNEHTNIWKITQPY